jgi:hypothetical protein
LELTFTVEELDEVLLSMKPDSAPSPDGLSVLFFKRFSGILRGPILQILNDFALGRVDIARLNYGIITLIPKVKGNIGHACRTWSIPVLDRLQICRFRPAKYEVEARLPTT